MPSELATKLAKAILEEYSVGVGSTFCDQGEFDHASEEELAELIDRVMSEKMEG